ncbi:MAG: gliding motility-associated C-terminal domain-containing protein, partial [Saprospiraceae bacterium]|nr:gliding motility-associated C-terminal domain-containing protein [Saprospiraceae bacterium]
PGDSIQLNVLETPGATYSWTSVPPIFSSNQAIPPVFYPSESAVYTVSTLLGDCPVNYTLEVTVFNPQMVVSNDTVICAGEPVTISADAFLTGVYQWTPGGAVPTFLDTVDTSTEYFLRFEYGEGCVYEDSMTVEVIPNFMVNIVSDPDTNRINVGESVLLDAVIVPSQNVNGFTFEWLENNTDPLGNTQQITVMPLTTDSTITYYVVAVAPSGCVQIEPITFRVVQPDVKIPNAFSPNGDGANDSFGLAIVEGIAFIQSMDIYNRWGQKVYSSSEPNARWDGTIGGQPAASDVYVYVIYYRGGDGALQFAKGDVTLIR